MSFLDKLFENKAKTPLNIVETIQKLRETEDMLSKKQEYLETKIEHEMVLAKKNAINNKQTAIQALKKKKRYEQQLKRIDGTLTTIEMQREALEVANTNTTVLKTMKSAAEALKDTHVNLDVEKVYNILDDVADQQELVNEISNAISSPVAFGGEIDEEEIEKELEALEEEALKEKLLQVPYQQELLEVSTTMGSEPKAKVGKKVAESDEEMKKLEQWAS